MCKDILDRMSEARVELITMAEMSDKWDFFVECLVREQHNEDDDTST